MTQLDSTSKEALQEAVRAIRDRLLEQLSTAADGAYQLSVNLEKSKLPEARRIRRERLEAWLSEQSRADRRSRAEHLHGAVKQAAHTLLNRLVVLRILEHHGLSEPAVVTGGLKSTGYREYTDYAQALVTTDDSRGYSVLLKLVFDELALDLPGMFGPVGLTALFPVPAATLRETVEALNDPALDPAWGDDTTLGWIYQFWNDPERERIDAKIIDGKKIEPHEIASKTQMFTERYMVEWLLQNSLGQTWLAMCKKHGWTADFDAVRAPLEVRRAEWRKQREAGEVAADALMPLESELEERWKYWVEQPLPDSAVAAAPERLADVKILDPACGSGHFLVIAFDLLAALYREEARHQGIEVSDPQIAISILENNLHGIDIDPRAVQIAAAALWLKAKLFAPEARVARMNLVAPHFNLASLAADDPARRRLEQELQREVGIPKELTDKLIAALAGVDHLGTLLRVDREVEEALREYDQKAQGESTQGDLFLGMPAQQLKLPVEQAKLSVLDKLGTFLAAHEAEQDLGLRLEGEQLAAGVRFVRLAQEATYDIVVGNPPYQGTSKLAEADWFKKHYPRGKTDLCGCFLERALELTKPDGMSALITMRGWMFLAEYTELRETLLAESDLRIICDIDKGGFEHMATSQLISVALTVQRNSPPLQCSVPALQPTAPGEKYWDRDRTARKRANVLVQRGRFDFNVQKLSGIVGTPLLYWWNEEFLDEYIKAPKLGEAADVKVGLQTSDNTRFIRKPWEIDQVSVGDVARPWVPYIKGAAGQEWVEPLNDVVCWRFNGAEIKHFFVNGRLASRPQNAAFYFQLGAAFTTIGSNFRARVHRFRSIFGDMGQSVFPSDPMGTVLFMNSTVARSILEALNPTVHFLVGDVKRLPILVVQEGDRIAEVVNSAFSDHESCREGSVEFRQPRPSPWRYAQAWAQQAVDREKGAPLPSYEPELDPPEPVAFVSFALGIALGRFGKDGEGILDEAPESALPAGILFLADTPTLDDSLSHPAAEGIRRAWAEHAAGIVKGKNATSETALRDYLREKFFDYHRKLYENRPIYFPLSSEKKSFVAYVSIHRWGPTTLQTLLADHLHKAREALAGQISDLNQARAAADKKAKGDAEKQYSTTKKLLDELDLFIVAVTQCAEKGAPPTDGKCPPREVDTTFQMDLDDGVMINSAALWPLLAPQWKDPKKWWKELCTANGRKDYDWAHLAARYFPARVDEKCRKDPSLGVAHHCFWKYHPAKAYAWELRLQDEIKPDFTIDEAPGADPLGNSEGSELYRRAFLEQHPEEAAEIEAKEHQRRERNRKKQDKGADAEQQVDDTLGLSLEGSPAE